MTRDPALPWVEGGDLSPAERGHPDPVPAVRAAAEARRLRMVLRDVEYHAQLTLGLLRGSPGDAELAQARGRVAIIRAIAAIERDHPDAERGLEGLRLEYHYARKVVGEVQWALSGWRTDPEKTIRQIAKIVGYYIA
jgi:hypothetical protein